MSFITRLIDEGDFCSLVIVVLIFAFVGNWIVQSKPTSRLWGLRLAATAFVLFAVMRMVESGVPSTSDLLSALFVGLGAGALILGPAWIVLGCAAFLNEQYVKLTAMARMRAEIQRRDDEQQRHKERVVHEVRQRSPEQERIEAEAAERRRRDVERAAEDAKRQEDALAACELLYNLRAPDIQRRMTREQFDDFVKKFMGQDKPVDVVERRAGELQHLIQQHYEAVSPPTRFADLSGLSSWYGEQQRLLESLAVADIYKKEFLVQLNTRYADLTQQLLEKL